MVESRNLNASIESVDEVMRKHPQTVRVFLKHNMRCVGCPIASYHDLGDVSRIYGLDPAALASEIAAMRTEEPG